MGTKAQKARNWVNGYTVAGTAIVIAAIIPGTTAAALCAMEAHMCYEIGKIYRGADYSKGEALAAAGAIGVACIVGQVAALEALNFVPFAGWAIKGVIAGTIIKGLGEAIIAFYEKNEK